MRIILGLLSLILSLPSQAQKPLADRPAVHGMMLMGKETVYASHLPMFHTPHDYQIILRLKLNTRDHQVYLKDKLNYSQEKIYTLEPEVFVLTEKVLHGKSFKANLYRGHFERGGTKILDNIEVEIAERIYYKQLDQETIRPGKKQYILFGNSEELFMAHLITKQPDFDEILQVDAPIKRPVHSNKNQYVLLEFLEEEVRKPFTWNTNQAFELSERKSIALTKITSLYLEYGDLD